jgi:hypothetical protein
MAHSEHFHDIKYNMTYGNVRYTDNEDQQGDMEDITDVLVSSGFT